MPGGSTVPNARSREIGRRPALVGAYPQLFVSDVRRASEYYTQVLGFEAVFLHGDPPFYGQVVRDGVRLNLRYVCDPVFDDAQRQRESLLSAYIDVTDVKGLYDQYQAAGADIVQALTKQAWGAEDFVVRDPDGNLLCFAS